MTDTFEVMLHDVETATAVIQVVSGGTVWTDTYDLKRVFPGTTQVLDMLGLELDEAAQLRAIEYVGRQMVLQMAGGTFQGDPVPSPVVEQEVPVAAPEPEMGYVQEEPAPPVEPHESLVPMEPVVTENEDGAADRDNQPEPSQHGTE